MRQIQESNSGRNAISISREQGVSKAGNPRLRTTLIQLSWLWLQQQPTSELSRWFKDPCPSQRRKDQAAIAAMARELLVALWKYVSFEPS
ncbi:MAG: hypothetical protein E5W28_00340 [Mesorhizobium sp.]|nr:hypothetical protein EOA25_24865 [Mesorhizobium sp. M2A.F.Ca.ET.040.01.1.1]RWD39483.1 MAG: hypothetical protein EOS59_33070 [Mesorhizobium sp.]RWD60800.1 MAG: hypothetical protein EOS60_33600 [Mesorhizobium sp.]TIU29633.1 MAG: hypothetical protein E5W34_00270 [Mesorhizobium sp.]TIU42908.1 MAG: hypothetical protein E5W28_00340 [Mesorhizobium sp.]